MGKWEVEHKSFFFFFSFFFGGRVKTKSGLAGGIRDSPFFVATGIGGEFTREQGKVGPHGFKSTVNTCVPVGITVGW